MPHRDESTRPPPAVSTKEVSAAERTGKVRVDGEERTAEDARMPRVAEPALEERRSGRGRESRGLDMGTTESNAGATATGVWATPRTTCHGMAEYGS